MYYKMLQFILLATAVAAAAISGPSANSISSRQIPSLPDTFEWSSSGVLVSAKDDGRNISGIKDPSIIYHNAAYHVFASTAQASGYSLVYFTFTDFAHANNATFHYLDQSAIGTGYRAAPQIFFFEPHNLWYLIYQNGNAAYSTNTDISDPSAWTAPTDFYTGTPAIVTANIGDGYWVDMWVICDAAACHLFSSDDNGHLYRSQTRLSAFPANMSEPVIALADTNKYALFEASNVYSYGPEQYLLLVEAIGSDGNRYFRSWNASAIEGPWTGLADSEADPFARSSDVVFDGAGGAWTRSISHGEVVRTDVDQRLGISPCGLRYLYQGLNPNATGDYNSLPWMLGLLTQTNSAC
ncbi:Alpha-L-arabinofuranosidase C [Lachnellula hyalina]|uniref:Alpha-L-arabinofuranosidase n=1 Tax=Lachnellula hyalina TaxID=1316788 RepID=A0A8H8R264_9HELO|nr:Alpha-L-arabinofuranosidase C [Lachnellula hyalina]TVY27008.1 Alpha-L-arabinofuranosidase C [Lachnellula hyalina]